ncbi:MAG: aspartate/glutamate racemase family protein [Candidatus Nitrosocaldus sp.]|nr:aspartate/glutamate racemase family protein [Candidatus Nitrosocaldus sp.]MDW7999761.1 aspartate/glutamate racemase family protein [Candidatus Nitrosocaldus sp.]
MLRPIGVFDSGLGSISVIRVLVRELPEEHIIYFADRRNYPYGMKSREELRAIVERGIGRLGAYDPKCVIVASITPSMLILNDLRLGSSIPLFGVYLHQCLERAVELFNSSNIAVLASRALVRSVELQDVFRAYMSRASVTLVDATELIDIVESSRFLHGDAMHAIADVCRRLLRDASIDCIVLGSTHIALIEDALHSLYPNIKMMNPVMDTVARVKAYLGEHGMLSREGAEGSRLSVIDADEHIAEVLRRLGLEFRPI